MAYMTGTGNTTVVEQFTQFTLCHVTDQSVVWVVRRALIGRSMGDGGAAEDLPRAAVRILDVGSGAGFPGKGGGGAG